MKQILMMNYVWHHYMINNITVIVWTDVFGFMFRETHSEMGFVFNRSSCFTRVLSLDGVWNRKWLSGGFLLILGHSLSMHHAHSFSKHLQSVFQCYRCHHRQVIYITSVRLSETLIVLFFMITQLKWKCWIK